MKVDFLLTVVSALLATGAAAQQQSKNWATMSGITGSLCIHSLLLPNRQLLCIERPHTKPYPFLNPNTNGTTATIVSLDLDKDSISYSVAPLKYNAFCAGHSQAADGGVHVIGGDQSASSTLMDASINYPNQDKIDDGTFIFAGLNRIRHFDPVSRKWDEGETMTSKRWYPTVVTLGDGTLFIASGATKNLDFKSLTDTINPTYEFYPRKYQDSMHAQILEWSFPHNLYPTAFQLPGGKIFMMVSNQTVLIDPKIDPGQNETNTAVIEPIPKMDHAPWVYPHTPTAFLLPMKESENWTASVVICGGSMTSTKDASADCTLFCCLTEPSL
ncbi:glyoxal oxidase N-terminus-domain-containing protein [Chytriomyces sp. MP71]|nr:glyoxal oxidase N-terminus-domain-containing protein [Chytriomyces sp. MP71]